MARTFEIACHDCKVTLWIGQHGTGSPPEKAYIYGTDKDRQSQRDFFYNHIGHRLEFNDSEQFSLLDYESPCPVCQE